MELLGTAIRNIRIVDVIGKGGMGEVYVGYHEKLQRRVALKRIRAEFAADSEMKARFLQEARLLSTLQLPNICQVFDYIETENGDFIVMELIEGQTLKAAMRDGLSRRDRLRIAETIANRYRPHSEAGRHCEVPGAEGSEAA